jgi:uncharacterized membrane protein YbhN (UPF0104 family)
MWTLSKVLIAVGVFAIGVAGVRFFRPVEVPGVQECGAPVPYLLFDREEIRPPGASLLEDVEGCRDLAYAEFEQGMLALGVGIALGVVGAVLGLVDDRWLLHRAPKFESLLRRRPADAPVALTSGATAKALSAGRSLPVLDPVDVLYLPLGMLATFILLRLVAGGEELKAAYEAAQFGYSVPALLAALALPFAAAAQLGAVHRGLGFGSALEITVASSFRGDASPSLGPFGLAAFLFTRWGSRRRDAIAELGAVTLASGISHGALLAVFVVAVGLLPAFVALPDMWWALVLIVVLSLTVGFFRGLTPGGRLVQRPDADAFRSLWASVTRDPLRGSALVGASFALPVLSGLVLAWSCSWAGLELAVPTVIGVVLVAQLAGSAGPMPGGVGVVEALAVWGLVGAGASLSGAVLAVLAYRVVTYWLPMAIGAVVATKTARDALQPT